MNLFGFFKKTPPAPAPASPAPEQSLNGFFSTHMERDDRLLPVDRYNAIMQRAIPRTQKDFVAVNESGHAMDSSIQEVKMATSARGFLPINQLEWYGSQTFIGWQLCAVLAQNWLVDKACTMPARDAVRNWFEFSVADGVEVQPEVFDEIARLDKKFKLKKNCIEFIKLGRVFGIRHVLFEIDGIDYELPFNIDGVRPGSYRGMTQVDPYWMAPELDFEAASNPQAKDFYEPTWWRINGRRIHKSHFAIMRNGEDLPDILKPTYFYGGIPTPQKIYERVYASERTANEAPLLAMTKRMTVLKMDASAAVADMAAFSDKMNTWVGYQNSFGVKVIGQDEEINQFDTNLSGLDETIMTQYQLVAAGADVPATKLLGTSPKGFNATGAYEESSYHEYLETIQENELSAVINRHHEILMRSHIAPKFGISPFQVDINWVATNSPTAKERAEINAINADTDAKLANTGAIDGLDIRQRLIKDKDSGYNGIPEVVEGGPGDREAQEETAEEPDIQAE